MEILDFAQKMNMTKKKIKNNPTTERNFNSTIRCLFNRLKSARDKVEAEAKGVPRANIVSARRCIINESGQIPCFVDLRRIYRWLLIKSA